MRYASCDAIFWANGRIATRNALIFKSALHRTIRIMPRGCAFLISPHAPSADRRLPYTSQPQLTPPHHALARQDEDGQFCPSFPNEQALRIVAHRVEQHTTKRIPPRLRCWLQAAQPDGALLDRQAAAAYSLMEEILHGVNARELGLQIGKLAPG